MYVNADGEDNKMLHYQVIVILDIQEDATLNGIMVVSIESDDIKVHGIILMYQLHV